MSLPTPKPSLCGLPAYQGRRVSVLFLALMLLGLLGDGAWGEKPPNIILILADDMGWDIAALGHPHVKTPHLDRLAEEGRAFENYYVASPVCSPTRVSFMTGVRSARAPSWKISTRMGGRTSWSSQGDLIPPVPISVRSLKCAVVGRDWK